MDRPVGRGILPRDSRADGSLTANSRLNLAVVGYRYWGPNIVRNLMERPELELWGLWERHRSA